MTEILKSELDKTNGKIGPKKEVTARSITPSTVKRLFALSGNMCSFPGCSTKVAAVETSVVTAEICHIEAAEEDGERWNPGMTNDERRHFDNLIVLCPTHHTVTNDVANYPVEVLKKMKLDHIEGRIRGRSVEEMIMRYPTALANVVNAIAASDLLIEDSTVDNRQDFKISEKIRFNKVVRFGPIIKEFAVYQGKLTRLYAEIESQGSWKKSMLLQNIRSLYLEAKGEFQTKGLSVNECADDILSFVEAKLWHLIDAKSDNVNEELLYEDKAIALRVVLVDAFMRCKILEEPTNK